MMAGDPHSIDLDTLHLWLMSRAARLAEYIAGRIPRRLRRAIATDDVLQDIWITAFRTVAGFRDDRPGAFDRWLWTIANHKLLDAIKSAQTLKRRGDGDAIRAAEGRARSFEDLLARLVSPDRTPSRAVSADEAARALQIALSSLSEERRLAVQMRYLEGRSRQEIAQALQLSPPAAARLVDQGLRQLRDRLGGATNFFTDA